MLAYVRARVRTRSDIILLERVSRRALTLFNMERLKIVLCIQNLFGRGERLAPPPLLWIMVPLYRPATMVGG